MRSFQIEVAGRTHRGTWLPLSANTILVGSASGQRKVKLSGRTPERAAREALAGMI